MTVDCATDHVESWLAQPCIVIQEPGDRFHHGFLSAFRELGTGGNLTTDAYLAALAIEHQAELRTCDGDFSRFAGLRWSNPVTKSGKRPRR